MTAAALSGSAIAAPCLRADLAIVEQSFRGETSFVVKDPATQKYFRFRPVEVAVMRCFDGRRTPDEIALSLAEQGMRLSARAVEGFARKLSTIGLMEHTLAERTVLEMERLRAERRRRRQPTLFRGELLRMRWSIGDPDRLFDRMLPAVRWCFSPAFLGASALLFMAYFVILAGTWGEFSQALVSQYSLANITFGSVVILWTTALLVIFIHELGHGFTCKYFGGEVHEMGFMLIYFQPAFYCNVNDAWSFPELRARLWVTAAGGWIQFVVAGLAAVVWYVAKPQTLVSEIAVAAMFVGGATTLITNMNPLMPLDGYFALTDWLEIPNLRQRALAYVGWWVRRHVLRLELPEPAVTDRERRIFLVYGVLAVVYIGAILSFVGRWAIGWAQAAFGAIGLILALAAIGAVARRQIDEWGGSLALSARALRARRSSGGRKRLVARATMAMLATVLLMAFIPFTLTTSGRFVVAPARTSQLTAPDSGIIAAVFVREGMRVPVGAPLARIVDRALERELLAATRVVDSVSVAASRSRALGQSAVAARLDDERNEALARLSAVRSRFDALVLRARWAGVVTTPRVEELEGRRVNAGTQILAIATLDSLEARTVLGQAGAARVHAGMVAHLVPYADPAGSIDASIAVVAPAGGRGPVDGPDGGSIEVRVPVRSGGPWRADATGEVKVELRRSNLLGAIWWAIRQRVRSDFLL